jgi:hypothetical protein
MTQHDGRNIAQGQLRARLCQPHPIRDAVRHHVISVSTTYPVEVDVQRKFRCCPGEQPKYSGKLAGRYVAEELAVISVAVLSTVAQMPAVSVWTTRTCRVCDPNAVVDCVAELPETAVTIDRANRDAGCRFP